jgi:broad specificity phosphatase PhoE
MFATLKLAALAFALARAGGDSTELKADSLLKVLRKGGYTILLRHARTDYSFNENPSATTADRSTQRNLSEAGVADARAIGQVMRSTGIPVGEILSSPSQGAAKGDEPRARHAPLHHRALRPRDQAR